MRRALSWALVAAALGGCAMPGWVPLLGGKKKPEASPSATPVAKATSPDAPRPGDVRQRSVETADDVADRVVAVVNNDAITLGEVQESIASFRAETRGQATTVSDEDLARQILTRLIDSRLQLQEADRDKITLEESEVNEEMATLIKRYGMSGQPEFEKMLKEQGITLEAVKKRVRESLRVNKVIRRKVALRVSVTDAEIDQYLAENRAKLETGLSYHARHILIVPDAPAQVAEWDAARAKALSVRDELRGGADFAEIAKKSSGDASAKDGGDLGTLKRGELSQDVEAAILALKPGQLSEPYRSPLGYHIFRLESKETLEGEGLARARQQIREILFREKYETRLDAWLKEIKQRAIIEVRM